MTKMIEKVSAAMFDRTVQIQQSEGYDGHVDLREIARAAIEAMMEPTAQMVADGSMAIVEVSSKERSTPFDGMTIHSDFAYAAWVDMISAVLGEDRHG